MFDRIWALVQSICCTSSPRNRAADRMCCIHPRRPKTEPATPFGPPHIGRINSSILQLLVKVTKRGSISRNGCILHKVAFVVLLVLTALS